MKTLKFKCLFVDILWWICMVYALFLTIFAFDVFSPENGYQFFEMVFAFLIHTIPSILLILFLLISKKWPLICSIGLLLFGLITMFAFQTYVYWLSFLTISMPILLVGILMLAYSIKQII